MDIKLQPKDGKKHSIALNMDGRMVVKNYIEEVMQFIQNNGYEIIDVKPMQSWVALIIYQ